MSITSHCCVIWTIVLLAFAATAQSISFTNPGPGATSLKYTIGEKVNITWQSTFASTSLVVFQQHQDGSYASRVLFNNFGPERSLYEWQVDTISNERLENGFHFELYNTQNRFCAACSTNSVGFHAVRNAPASTPTTSSSSASSSSSSSAPLTSSSSPASTFSTSTISTAPATVVTVTATATQTHHNADNAVKLGVGLGVGLGIGIPATLAVMGAIGVSLIRQAAKRMTKKQRDEMREKIEKEVKSELEKKAASRAEKRAGKHLRPAPVAGVAEGRPTLDRDGSAGSKRSDTGSGGGDRTGSGFSQTSWIEPFDFERQGHREQDEMSELRSSFYSSRRSQVSNEGLREMPEMPQPVHQQDQNRWPLG